MYPCTPSLVSRRIRPTVGPHDLYIHPSTGEGPASPIRKRLPPYHPPTTLGIGLQIFPLERRIFTTSSYTVYTRLLRICGDATFISTTLQVLLEIKETRRPRTLL